MYGIRIICNRYLFIVNYPGGTQLFIISYELWFHPQLIVRKISNLYMSVEKLLVRAIILTTFVLLPLHFQCIEVLCCPDFLIYFVSEFF